MNNALKILAATKPPAQMLINDETITEAMGACPLLADIYSNRNKDPFYAGLATALNTVYDALESAGQEMIMTELSQEDMVQIDDAMTKNAENLVTDLPYVQAIMVDQQPGDQFKAGIILGFVVVAEKLRGITDAAEVADIPEAEEPSEVTDAVNAGRKGTDVTLVLYALRQAGFDFNDLHIIPKEEDGKIIMAVGGDLGHNPDFETIAKLNALFMTISGRGVQLKTKSPVEFYFEV